MERKNRNWFYLVPVAGAVFCLWYLYTSFYDVVYSDYIRLVNSYLPDVWNPAKFWVPDLLTRVPVNFLARIINITFFHYSIRFDQVLGVVSLALSAVSVTYYVNQKQIGTIWFLAVMAVMFSLNKWEMLNNGSGWVHFLAFAGFYYHYQIWDRVWGREERKGDHLQMILLPWILILAVAGPYCAVYVAVLIAGYAFCMTVTWKREKRLEKRYLLYGLSVLLPFFCYLWSNAQVVPDWSGYGAAQGSLLQNLFRIPGYFIRFMLKSLASVVTGQELAKSLWSTNLPYLAVGIFVAAAYLMALYLQFSRKLYETTVFPLVMLVSGALNHALILLSRWSFLVEDYGMSSRYALQFQVGVVGILLTLALCWKECQKAGRQVIWRGAAVLVTAIFLLGNITTTRKELQTAPYRKELCVKRAETALDFENKTDDELRAEFEFRTSWDQSGAMVRSALTILKENHWNVFHQ
ncbi:hypothetical protein DW974_14560 [Lachnospiraceae bacterium AM48-27BH]|nr:hypothetical protein DW974_14560 [Lachnospiraceae bacterium AM48-27BH]